VTWQFRCIDFNARNCAINKQQQKLQKKFVLKKKSVLKEV
jgi:hypothetical protein